MTAEQLSALAAAGVVLREGCRLCDAHRKRAARLCAATVSIGANHIQWRCCYCNTDIIAVRPCRPVINGVKSAAHPQCVVEEKRRQQVATEAARQLAAMAATTAAAEEATDRRIKSLRTFGKSVILKAA